jgi:hypothetical protein
LLSPTPSPTPAPAPSPVRICPLKRDCKESFRGQCRKWGSYYRPTTC